MVFRRKKKEEEYDEEEEDDYDEEEEEEDIETPRPKALPMLPKKERKEVRPQQKFIAIHQPEMVGIRDEETGEMKEFNIAVELADIKSRLWDIQQRL